MPDNPRTVPGASVALTIAGSDSSGAAGLQADLKTFAVMGIYGASVVTAVTAQNTTGVKKSFTLDPELVEAQIDAVASDLRVAATKTGMLGSAANIHAVAKAIKRANLFPLVVDPVMVSKSGDPLIDDNAVKVLAQKLLPLAAVVTPNKHEAARLLGLSEPVSDTFTATDAARKICAQFGAAACIVKGIQRQNGDAGQAVDIYFDGKQAHEIVSEWRPTPNTNGSGCVFSAAITAALALGQPIDQAIQTAKTVVSEAIRQATDLGHGVRPVNHLAYANVKK